MRRWHCAYRASLLSAFAADDPLAIVNNFHLDFVFSLIRAVGVILLGWGRGTGRPVVPEPRPQPEKPGFLTLAGGLVITFCAGDPRIDRVVV